MIPETKYLSYQVFTPKPPPTPKKPKLIIFGGGKNVSLNKFCSFYTLSKTTNSCWNKGQRPTGQVPLFQPLIKIMSMHQKVFHRRASVLIWPNYGPILLFARQPSQHRLTRIIRKLFSICQINLSQDLYLHVYQPSLPKRGLLVCW